MVSTNHGSSNRPQEDNYTVWRYPGSWIITSYVAFILNLSIQTMSDYEGSLPLKQTHYKLFLNHSQNCFHWPCFLGRSTVNLCRTSLVLPQSVPNKAPFPSITMKANLLSSARRAFRAWQRKMQKLMKNDHTRNILTSRTKRAKSFHASISWKSSENSE